jgi:Fe-S oxidoreductase
MQQLRQERHLEDIPVRTHAGTLEALRSLQMTGKGKGVSNDWTTEDLEFDDVSDVALFVGCVPLLDIVFSDLKIDLKSSLRASVRLLNRMGIRPRLLKGERCCGHDSYWLGEQRAFEELAKRNIEVFRTAGIKEIISVCPECAHSIGILYPECFGEQNWIVHHISEVIAEGIEQGKIVASNNGNKVTYQDPCRLGRQSGHYDEPRKAIGSVAELVEMPRNREMAACCGSTCFVQCDENVKRWQTHRLAEARETGAEQLITACPKCMIHLSCAQKDFGTHKDRPKIKLRDLSVLIDESMDRERK